MANNYVFKLTLQQWNTDPYYVGSSAPVHSVEVIASTEVEAKAEAVRVLGEPARDRYWRCWVTSSKDVRLVTGEAKVDGPEKA